MSEDTPRLLWEPGPWEDSRLGRFAHRLESDYSDYAVAFDDDYESLRRWSLEHLDTWWLEVWRELRLPAAPEPTVALEERTPFGPGSATWFSGISTNYAEAMLALPGRGEDDVVVVSRSQSRGEVTWTAAELRLDVARVRAGLVSLGVERGDRVAAYAPNIGETLVLLLATASLGAVFCSVAPEFGAQSVIDRLGQVEPKVLLVVDGYRYGDKPVSREAEVAEVLAALPTLEAVIHLPYLAPDSTGPAGTEARTSVLWADLHPDLREVVAFESVPFDHPLYVLFSSGTTGLPKPIVHGHGGITLGHGAALGLFTDLGPTDRFSWFSTTGWMMWNYLVSGLLVGSTVVLFDGDPAHPSLMSQWELAAEARLTYYGTSAPFLMACRKQGLRPGESVDLSRLRGIGSTGAPLPAEGFAWVHEAVSSTAQLASMSGGTDVCNAFVGATPLNPVWEGEISARLPGIAVEALSASGEPVVDEVGELVVTRPMPSMPVGFWGDEDGSRYAGAYFEDIPGVWRHGDWVRITPRGSLVITGRSDATLNRGGVRLGTAEFYRVVEELPEVRDSLVVHLEDSAGGAGELVLFVSLAPGASADGLAARIAAELRSRLSPRHVPDTLEVVRALPRTLSGKKLEVPVKKILRGARPADVVAAGALDDPAALEEIAAYAAARS